MATMDSHGYYEIAATQKTPCLSNGRVAIARSARVGRPRATFQIEDPRTTPSPALSSIGSEMLRHIFALLRLAFDLHIMSLKATMRFWQSLSKRLLQRLERVLGNLPRWARSRAALLESQVRARWPGLCRLLDRSVVIPFQVIKAIRDFDESTKPRQRWAAMEGSGGINLDDSADGFITLTFVKRCSGPTTEHERVESQGYLKQIIEPVTMDDMLALEEHSCLGQVYQGLVTEAQRLGSEDMASPLIRNRAIPKPNSIEQEATDKSQHQGVEPYETEIQARKPCPPLARSQEDAAEPLGQHHTSPNNTPWPVDEAIEASILDDTRADQKTTDSETHYAGASKADAETSSDSSNSSHNESLSPSPVSVQRAAGSEPPPDLWNFPTLSPQTEYRLEPSSLTSNPIQPFPQPEPGHARKIRTLHPTDNTLKDIPPYPTGHYRRSQNLTSDSQLADDEVYQRRDPPSPSSCGSHAGSCSQGSDAHLDQAPPPTPGTSSKCQSTSSAEDCDEACISCETCDRHHRRARQSKIPRRSKTLEHLRPRSSSFGSSQSVQSAGEMGVAGTGFAGASLAGTTVVVRRKLQKRWLKPS